MLLKIVYVLTCRVLSLVVLAFRGELAKDAELLMLRHENAVLRRHAGQVRHEPADQTWLAALARLVPRKRRDPGVLRWRNPHYQRAKPPAAGSASATTTRPAGASAAGSEQLAAAGRYRAPDSLIAFLDQLGEGAELGGDGAGFGYAVLAEDLVCVPQAGLGAGGVTGGQGAAAQADQRVGFVRRRPAGLARPVPGAGPSGSMGAPDRAQHDRRSRAALAGIDPDLIPFTAVLGLVRSHVAADACCRHCSRRASRPGDPLAGLLSAILALPRHRPGRQRTCGRTVAERRARHTEEVRYAIEITKSNLPQWDGTPKS